MIRFFIYKLFILSVFCVSAYGYASVTTVKYEGGISLYGKVAEASVVLQENLENGTYRVEVTTSSTGLVKTLTSNRCDTFVSEGKIVGGVYLPSKFTKTTTKTDYLKRVTYTFNYEENKVIKETYLEELESKSYYDISKLEMVDENKLVQSTKKKYLDMKKNDFISLYLNLSSGNLKVGDVAYIDQKDSDIVSLISQNSFEVSKNDAEDVYRIDILNSDGMFFTQAMAVDIGFYGDAYVKKISEQKTVLN